MSLAIAACGSDPTATPPPTNTPTAEPSPTPTPTLEPGATPSPTPTPGEPTPTPTPSGFDAEEYFSGRTVTINVGFSPGGGYDTFSRLFAANIANYMPGNPRFVVRNLPGSGGLRGIQQTLMDDADGLTVGILHPRFVKRELAGEDVEGFDVSNIRFVGSASAVGNTEALYVRSDIATSWEEVVALGRDITLGMTEPGSSTGTGGAFIQATGGPVNVVYGYGGTSEILAAVDRGELDSTTAASPELTPNLFPEWIDEQFVVPVLRWGWEPEDDPEFGGWMEALGTEIPPHIFDVLGVNESQQTVFELSEALDNTISRVFILHPDTDQAVADAWRDAFREMVADPEFVEAAAIAGYETGYADPETMRQTIQDGVDLLDDPALRELFVALAGTD